MFLVLDPVLYIWGYLFIVYVTLFRLIVLYSRCGVNRDTNMFVVCVLYNIFYVLLPLQVWAPCGFSQPIGCVPTMLQSTP